MRLITANPVSSVNPFEAAQHLKNAETVIVGLSNNKNKDIVYLCHEELGYIFRFFSENKYGVNGWFKTAENAIEGTLEYCQLGSFASLEEGVKYWSKEK